jgi:hypothetical protein
MKVRGIIWLDSIVEKIDVKHGVSQEEVHQVLQGRAMFRFVETGHRPPRMCMQLSARPGQADI